MTVQSETISPSAGMVGTTASRRRWPDHTSGLRAVNSLSPLLLGGSGQFSRAAVCSLKMWKSTEKGLRVRG